MNIIKSIFYSTIICSILVCASCKNNSNDSISSGSNNKETVNNNDAPNYGNAKLKVNLLKAGKPIETYETKYATASSIGKICDIYLAKTEMIGKPNTNLYLSVDNFSVGQHELKGFSDNKMVRIQIANDDGSAKDIYDFVTGTITITKNSAGLLSGNVVAAGKDDDLIKINIEASFTDVAYSVIPDAE